MTSRHLGDRLHLLLDERLPRAEAAEAMTHLEACEECAARWRGLREARAALTSSEAGIDMTFARQLLDRDRIAEIAQREDPRHVRAARPRDRRPVVLTTSLTLLAAALTGAAYAAGAPEDVDPGLSASSSTGAGLSVASIDSQSMRSGEQLSDWIHPDWQSSGITPVGARILQADSGEMVLVAQLLYSTEMVQVAEQVGRLPEEYVADRPQVSVDGVDAYLVGSSPTTLVWQAGEVVVALTCHCASSTLEEIATTFPQDDEPGFVDQVIAGFGVFADAVSGK